MLMLTLSIDHAVPRGFLAAVKPIEELLRIAISEVLRSGTGSSPCLV